MWVAKFVFDASKALVGKLAVKNKLHLQCYPVSICKEEAGIRVTVVIILLQDHSKEFVKQLRATGKMVFCNHKGNLIIGQLMEEHKYALIYNPEIIHLRPWMIDGEKGVETLVIGSWKRKNLTKIGDVIKNKHLGKMIYIKRKDPTEFFVVNILPNMTAKQRKALELAIKNGYYSKRRKTNLYKLAEIMKVAYPTFRAHLRKAEQKLIPYLFGHEDDEK